MTGVVYTIFTKHTLYTSAKDGRPETLQGMIDFVLKQAGGIPVCWAAEATIGYGGTKPHTELRREAMDAGRLVQKVDDKYVPVGFDSVRSSPSGEHAPASAEYPFRVGGIYRQQNGDLVKLTKSCGKDRAWGVMLSGRHKGDASGLRRLVDGKHPLHESFLELEFHLIPGEVDEAGVPITPNQPNPEQFKMANAEKNLKKSSHPADVKMAERDLKGLTKKVFPVKEETKKDSPKESKIKPALPGLGLNFDLVGSYHLTNPRHGSAMLH